MPPAARRVLRVSAHLGLRSRLDDLDLQFGDVALCLGLPPEKTMYDLAVSGGSLDEDKLAFEASRNIGPRAPGFAVRAAGPRVFYSSAPSVDAQDLSADPAGQV